jgi:hypothetical protein
MTAPNSRNESNNRTASPTETSAKAGMLAKVLPVVKKAISCTAADQLHYYHEKLIFKHMGK